MTFLSNPQIHPYVGMGVNALAAFATQKPGWHPQTIVNAVGVASIFNVANLVTSKLIKSAPPVQVGIMMVSRIITSDKNTQGEKIEGKPLKKKMKENDFRLEKVARAVASFIITLGLSKLIKYTWNPSPPTMRAAAAFCIIPTLLLLNESQPKPLKN